MSIEKVVEMLNRDGLYKKELSKSELNQSGLN